MALDIEINYEKNILEHLKTLGCPECKLIKDLVEYPFYSKTLLEEARWREKQDKNHQYKQ